MEQEMGWDEKPRRFGDGDEVLQRKKQKCSAEQFLEPECPSLPLDG